MKNADKILASKPEGKGLLRGLSKWEGYTKMTL
jgi:hypothetical protein